MAYTPLELAQVFIKTGELQDALDALATQLEQHPDDDETRRLRAQVLLRLPSPDNLRTALEDLDSLPQKQLEDHVLESIVHERAGQPDKAIHAMQIAHRTAPHDPRINERLIDLLITHADYQEALRLIQAQPRTRGWLEREADLLVKMGQDTMATARYGLALSHMDQTFDVANNQTHAAMKARVLMARGNAYRRLGQIDTARDHYIQARSLMPDDPALDFNLGLLAASDNQPEKALSLCQNALKQAAPALRAEMLQALTDEKYRTLSQHLV